MLQLTKARLKRDTSLVGRIKRKRRKCEACGWRLVPEVLHAHHIVPLSCGGSDTRINLIVLCPNHHAIAHAVGTRKGNEWFGARTRDTLLRHLKDAEKGIGHWWKLGEAVRPMVESLREAKAPAV